MSAIQKPEVMMGHVKECFTHLVTALGGPKGTRKSRLARTPVAEFCGVDEPAVYRWICNEDRIPRGGVLIKLMCFLNLMGYRVIEFDSLPALFRNFAELIGFGVITPKQGDVLLGYSDAENNVEIYKILLDQNRAFSDHRRELMLNAWKERREALEEKKKEAEKKYYSASKVTPSSATPLLALYRKEGEVTAKMPTGPSAVLIIMTALLELLAEKSVEDLGPITNTDAQLILKLSSRLSDLSSGLIVQNQRREESDAT